MAKTLVKSLLRCLGMTVLVFGPGVLLSMASLTAGMIWMLVGSFAMVAWSYRKPWRMSWLTCMVPPIASVLCYVAQLALAKGGPNVGLFTGAGALGLCVGAFSGWTHKVFVRDNRVFARRTAVYLLVWFAAYAFTQAVAVAGRYEIANIGRLGGMFTTAMVLTLAVVLTIKYVRTRRRLAPMQASRPPGRAGNVILPVLLLVGAASAVAQVNYRYGTPVPVESADQAVDRLITGLQIQPGQSKGRSFILEPSDDRRTEARISVQLLADRDRAVRLMQQDMEGSRQTAGGSSRGTYERLELGEMSYYAAWDHTNQRVVTGWPGRGGGGVRTTGSYVGHGKALSGRWLVEAQATFSVKDPSHWPASTRRAIITGMLSRALARLGERGAYGTPVVPATPSPASAQPTWVPSGTPVSPRQDEDAAAAGLISAVVLTAAGWISAIGQAIANAATPVPEGRASATGAAVPPPPLPPPAAGPPPPPPPSPAPEGAPPETPSRRVWTDQPGSRPLEGEPGWDNTTLGWWINLLTDARIGIETDRAALPGEAASAAASAAKTVVTAMIDPINVETVAVGTLQTAGELIAWGAKGAGLPTGPITDRLGTDKKVETGIKKAGTIAATAGELIAWGAKGAGLPTGPITDRLGTDKKVETGIKTAGTIAATVAGKAAAALQDDFWGSVTEFVGTMLGKHSWTKAIDWDLPVLERTGRALWGSVEASTTIMGVPGMGETVARGVSHLDDLARGVAAAESAAAGRAVAAVRGATAAKAAAGLGDEATAAGRAAGLGDEARAGGRAAGLAEEGAGAARAARTAEEGAGLAGKGAPAGARQSGPAPRGEGGIPEVPLKSDAYIESLPDGAIIPNEHLPGTGYTAQQIQDMAEVAREGEVRIVTRLTNPGSMPRIRDGKAVCKPIWMKAKTINSDDILLGMAEQDRALVGYFRPRRPNTAGMSMEDAHRLLDRYYARVREYDELRPTITQLITEGKIVTMEGKVYQVMGNGKLLPFTGDIDAVHFLDAATGQPLSPEKMRQVRALWRSKPNLGQHGAEAYIVVDLGDEHAAGSAARAAAQAKARTFGPKLRDAHLPREPDMLENILADGQLPPRPPAETAVEMGTDGILRRRWMREGFELIEDR